MKDFVQNQKVIKVGNSYAVTLDSKFVETNTIQAGDPVVASYAETHVAYAIPSHKPDRQVVFRDSGNRKAKPPQAKKLSKAEQRAVLYSKITPEFQAWVEKTLEEDKEILKELAHL